MKKILAILLFILVLSGCSTKKVDEESTNKEQTQEYTSIGDKNVGNLSISDFLVVYEDNVSTVYFDINNTTNEIINYNYLIINLYDNSKKGLLSYKIELGAIQPNSIKQIKESFDADLTKAVDVKYELTNE